MLPGRAGLRVLEIGCGDGRLTRRYAHLADHVLAIDSSAADLEEFRASMPAAFVDRIELRASPIATLQMPDEDIDLVLMSWSL